LIAILGVLSAAAVTGCGNSAPHGPPVLQQVYWETRGGVQTLVWSLVSADGPVATSVSPAATQFDLVFDRVIDGSKIEDTVTTNGISRQVPKATPPVNVTWPNMVDPAGGKFSLTVWYNSIHLPIEPANTSYVYGREVPSYPSSTTLSINLVPDGITSEYNEPMAPIAPITLTTEPFSVAINPTPGATGAASTPVYVPTNFWVPLQFNNIPIDVVAFAAKLPQYLQVRQNGVLLTAGQYQLQASASDPTLILLQPGSIQIWDSGAQLEVTLSADLPDIYGAVLGASKSASFIPCQLVSEDAGVRTCAPPSHPATDGGASDGGASDGGASDGGASDRGASDAGATDAGASDAGASDAGDASVVIDAPVDMGVTADSGVPDAIDAAADTVSDAAGTTD
jgi:hypothetical protein